MTHDDLSDKNWEGYGVMLEADFCVERRRREILILVRGSVWKNREKCGFCHLKKSWVARLPFCPLSKKKLMEGYYKSRWKGSTILCLDISHYKPLFAARHEKYKEIITICE
jgi:hypothetical protein